MSGVYSYTWLIHKLVPQKYTKNLTEQDPKTPLHQTDIAAVNFTSYPIFTPPESGMYSVLLQISDGANNTRYARRLVLYDNTSSVTVNTQTKNRMKVISGVNETDYKWQASLNSPIVITWRGHFENKFHVDNMLLNFVDPFQTQDYGENIIMKVDPIFEAKYGKRTMNKVSNVGGIVKFEYAFKGGHGGGKNIDFNPDMWYNVTKSMTETQAFNSSRSNGDTLRIWLRATDIMGNQNVDHVDVNFDATPPSIENFQFENNVNSSNYAFSSR